MILWRSDWSRVVAATTIFLAFLSGCNDSSGGSATQAKPAAGSAPPRSVEDLPPIAQQAINPLSGPKIQFDKERIDFGKMLETETRSAKIHFTNIGGQTLRIENVTATCGCTVPTLRKFVYEPGEAGEIDVRFEPTGPNDPGQPQIKYVNVASNASAQPLKVTIVADVQAFIQVEPRMLQFGKLPYKRGHTEIMTISCLDKNFELLSINAQHAHISTRILADDPRLVLPGAETESRGKRVEVVVSPEAPWGGLYCAMDITVRGRTSPELPPITHTTSIRVAGQVFGKVEARMDTAKQLLDTFRFGIDPGQQFERRVQLFRPDGQPFRIIQTSIVESELDSAMVRAESHSPDVWDVVLVGTGAGRAQNYRGIVRVQTDVPGEETIDIPIFGVIRKGPGA